MSGWFRLGGDRGAVLVRRCGSGVERVAIRGWRCGGGDVGVVVR